MEAANNTEIKQKDLPNCKFRLHTIADTLYAIGGKWKLQVVMALLESKGRFNELQRTIDGISSKVLASELKDLELNGFIKRSVLPGPPVVVEYELTEYSRSLQDVLDALFEWGAQHRQELKKQIRRTE